MLLEEAAQLLQPGYTNMETGYLRLPNGQMYVAILSQMPGCKGKWMNWWVRTHLEKTYKGREPQDRRLSNEYEIRKLENFIGTSPLGKHLVEKKILKFGFRFDDPAKFFDTSEFSEADVISVICGESLLSDGTPEAYIMHLIRDTAYGCEIRTRVWIYKGTEAMALRWMENYLDDFINLADYLRMFIEERRKLNNRPIVMCKFCHSYEVVKNGSRKSTQYWLCKNCGRGFVNNQALPRMRYPKATVSRAVCDYHAGKSIHDICRSIEQEFHILPSDAAVLGWIRKMSQMVATDS